jgi:hypothetical protein
MTHPQHPTVQGNWVPADQSKNRVELAPTDIPDVLAIRDSFDTEEVIYATPRQVMALAEAVQKGLFSNIVRA